MRATDQPSETYDVEDLVASLPAEGIVFLKGAFSRPWAERMGEDLHRLFAAAIQREGGAVARGPNRYYVEIHPEELRGFLDLVTHPWVVAVCQAVLGPSYEIVEIGFDTPFPGAQNQPWHRDFPAPRETFADRRLTSLAFNLSAVDVVPEMGPFEIAVGTQYEEGAAFEQGMFPPRSEWPRYEALAVQKMPQMGDVSARSALAVHRGTANRSTQARPVLVLGVDAPGAGHAALHDLQVTRAYYEALPEQARAHLCCRVVKELEPIVQKHQIDGLSMGA